MDDALGWWDKGWNALRVDDALGWMGNKGWMMH